MTTEHNPFASLLEKTVQGINVDADTQEALRFDCGYRGNDLVYVGTYADCCSETWFADIVGTENLIGQCVIGVEILELPEPKDERSRQEFDQAYGVRLKTSKGHCDIIYRNSSNGYYGGSAEMMSGEQGQKRTWLAIMEDWQS